MIKNIFFDFDGVIAESVSAKTEAFREIYSLYGIDVANKVVDHHIHHGGISRFEKFKLYHQAFLGIILSEEQINTLAKSFSNIVLDKVINSDEVKGLSNFLEKNKKKYRFWIITGTPTDEMKIIAKKRGIIDYFEGLYGSPMKKTHWTEHLIAKYNLKREETLFLGDATTDYNAAKFSKLHFALREHEENKKIFRDYNGIRFKDYLELEKKLISNFK